MMYIGARIAYSVCISQDRFVDLALSFHMIQVSNPGYQVCVAGVIQRSLEGCELIVVLLLYGGGGRVCM